MNTEQITEKLTEEFDNKNPGHVFDFDIMPAGKQNGLDHNGVWVRVIKLDNNSVAYAMQTDSCDEDFAVGSIESAADYIDTQIVISKDNENE